MQNSHQGKKNASFRCLGAEFSSHNETSLHSPAALILKYIFN